MARDDRNRGALFCAAAGTGADWRRATEACLEALGAVPAGANLGFLYTTDGLAGDFSVAAQRLREATGVEHWVGTVGMGICANGTEYYDAPAVAALVGAFPPDAFRVFPTLDADLFSLRRTHGDWYRRHAAHFGVVHGDPRSPLTPQLIPALAHEVPNAYLVGGLASSRDDYAQFADGPCEAGVSGVLFSDQVAVATCMSQGCTPIADKHLITRCDRNILTTLDQRPALEVFEEDIGQVLARDLQRVGGYIFVALPLSGSDTGDYLVRNLMGIDRRGRQLIIGDLVREGQQVQFCRRDAASAWEDLQRTLESLKARVDGRPRGALYYSCIGRGRHLFGDASQELQAVQAELGDVPLVGFFANGEIANDQLYGYTGVLTVFL
ncbi:MAG: FIST C-terminal domain-containing protein [Gammaproteobacteria bacterium]